MKDKISNIMGRFNISGFAGILTAVSSVMVIVLLAWKIMIMDAQLALLATRVVDLESMVELNDPIVLPDNFNYVYDRFKVFNPDVDTNVVISFVRVCNEYGFDKKPLFDYMIGQVLTESSGVHSTVNGDVVVGVSGAIGLCQIQVTTGLNYLTKKVKNRSELYSMGCSEFSFVDDESLTQEEKKSKTLIWLSDYRNNIILWGFIMNDNLKRRGVKECMVIYNAGLGGYKVYVDSGNSIDSHSYIVAINKSIGAFNTSM